MIAFHEFYVRIESVHMKAISAEREDDEGVNSRAFEDVSDATLVFNRFNDELGERETGFLDFFNYRKCLVQFVFN